MASASATAAPLDVTVLAMVAARHGSPFYVADTGRLRTNISALLAAFRRYYPKTSVAYSYKTNYLPAFIRVAHHLGACSEVVSRVELDLAMALGIPGDRIIFNGPVKTARDLALAHRAGACVNVDSLAEARLVAEIARTAGTDVSVGLRCHLGPLTPRSRFGMDLEAADGKTVVQTLDACARVRIAGLHCHYSGDRSASRYQERLSRMAHVHATVLGARRLDFLNMGGGFSSRMSPELAAQFPAPPSSFDDYAAAVGGSMAEAYGAEGPTLILEPGMGVLADTMTLATRVQVVKRLHGRNLAVVDGSIFNVKPLRGGVNLPLTVLPASSISDARVTGMVDVVGHTCMEIDVLHTGYPGTIAEGDWVLVENVGAYSNVLNAPFIQGTPAIVERCGDDVRLLRRSSTLADLLATYSVDA